jgi:hypothetical protein
LVQGEKQNEGIGYLSNSTPTAGDDYSFTSGGIGETGGRRDEGVDILVPGLDDGPEYGSHIEGF